MKSFTISIFLLVFTAYGSNAQDVDLPKPGKARAVYFSSNINFLTNPNINSQLERAGLLKIRPIMFGVSFGMNVPLKTGLISVTGGVGASQNEKDSELTRLKYLEGSLSYIVRAIKTSEYGGFYFGAGYNISVFGLEAASKKTSLDLDNISTGDLQGALLLNNLSHAAEFSLLLKSDNGKNWWNRFDTKISYVLDLSKSAWKSDSVNLTGDFSENFSRVNLSFGLSF